MINNKDISVNNKSTFKQFFYSLNLSKFLKRSGGYSTKGIGSIGKIFECLCALIFSPTINSYIKSERSENSGCYGKSSIYRFLENPKINWRRFLLLFSNFIVGKITSSISSERETCFVVDDTPIARSRSSKTEMLSWVFNHVNMKNMKGFLCQALMWTDGYSNIPLDFALVGSSKDDNCINPVTNLGDLRLSSTQRILDAKKKKTDLVIEMLDRALSAGINADYVLCDTWYTTAPFIQRLRKLGPHVIGMVKHLKNTVFEYKKCHYSVVALRELCERKVFPRTNSKNVNILGSIIVATKVTAQNTEATKLKMVFVRNTQTNSNKILCLISTKLDLSDDEICRIYGKRWGIETMFKSQKQLFKLVSGCNANKFTSIISYMSMVYLLNQILEYMRRLDNDGRAFNDIFRDCYQEVADVTLDNAINILLEIYFSVEEEILAIEGLKKSIKSKISQVFTEKITLWYDQLSVYVKNKFHLDDNGKVQYTPSGNVRNLPA